MTFWDLFALWRRQWIATSLCLLAVLGGGWYLDRSVSEVYWASTSVVIRPPYLRGHLAPLGRDAIPLAGVVEKRHNAVNHAPPAVSPDVSIVDRGIYDGWVANVPDYGGQWANNFTNPVIYTVFDDLEHWVKRKTGGMFGRVHADPAPQVTE